MTALALVAFGPPELKVGGAPAPPELMWRKHFGLLVYLARSPGRTRRRDHLVGLLWPEKDEVLARHSLNEACRAIRRVVGEALESKSDAVALAGDALEADWDEVERALAAPDWRRLIELWRGDFLEGFGIPDASPFEDWLAAERASWAARLRGALTSEGEALVRRGRHRDALEAVGRALRSEPSEGAVRVAMLAETLAGGASAAQARFERYAAWLRDEHGARPPGDLALLAERIRSGQRPAAATPEAAAPALPPLAGRASVLAGLAGFLPHGETTRAATVLIAGGLGYGKSRVLREVVERARLLGRCVLRATCVAADADAPGAALAAVLRAGLVHAAGLAAAPPQALAILGAMEPEIARRYPGAAPQPPAGAEALGRAAGEALAAVADETPVVVALDDAHLADDLSLEALPALLRAAEKARLLLALTVRADQEPPEALTALRARIGHDVPGAEARLEPLADGEVAELVGALLPSYGEEERNRLVRRLRREAGGVPLFVVEILRALAAFDPAPPLWPTAGQTSAQALPFPVPGAAVAALTLRVHGLGAPERESLLAAAIAGPRVDPELVAGLLGASAEDVERRFAAAERAGFLRDDAGTYHFTAEIVRAFLEAEMLTAGERRRLHRRAAELVARRGGTDKSLAHAEHLAAAGEWRAALEAAARVRDAADGSGAARLGERAARLVAQAERQVATEAR